MLKRVKYFALLVLMLLPLQVSAEQNEHELSETLKSLRTELRKDYRKRTAADKAFAEQYKNQRREMIATMKKTNELAIVLYSQKQDYTFDLSYALESVTKEYEEFTSRRLPYDQIVSSLDWDIDRYARLVESLRRLPPELGKIKLIPDSLAYHNDTIDRMSPMFPPIRNRKELDRIRKAIAERMAADSLSKGKRPFILSEEEEVDRDSCIFYAAELLKLCAQNKTRVISDSTHYQHSYLRLKESYDYSTKRYAQLQDRIFKQGQAPYYRVFRNFGRYWSRAAGEIRERYNFGHLKDNGTGGFGFTSPRRGPILVGLLLMEFVALLAITLIVALLFKLFVRFVKPVGKKVSKEQHLSFIFLISIIINGILIMVQEHGSNFLTSASYLIATYLWLLGATVAALLIRLKPEALRSGIRLYLPLMITALAVIGMRVVFMPNAVMNVFFTPLLLIFFIWQLAVCIRHGARANVIDRSLGWLTLLVLGVATAVSFAGYVFVALIIMVGWFFLMAAMQTLITLYHLLEQFKEKHLSARIDRYKKNLTFVSAAERDNLLFGATWFYDLVKTVFIPVLTLFVLPFCIKFALDVFGFSDLFEKIYFDDFIKMTGEDGAPAFRMSFHSIIVGIGLFFVFRYINYALYSLYQSVRYSAHLKRTGRKTVRKDEINFSLGKSLISILVWACYVVTIIVMLKIPTTSLTVIAGGLSAGIGIALKDVINNFIYGIQLMSGRLKVGDWIECDGVRGRVTNISYQSTQIETMDNAVMSFLNATLFNKNFSNLTNNNSYEFVKIIVGVNYGQNVEEVRKVLVEALQVMCTKDNYGREVVDPKKGIYVVFDSFGDSSVNLAVKQYVLVAERIGYVDRAKEVIYEALNNAGISIPFPQRDIHIISE